MRGFIGHYAMPLFGKIVQLAEKTAVSGSASHKEATHMPQKNITINQKLRDMYLLDGFIRPRECSDH